MSFNPAIPEVLPHGKMYKLQIGDKLFLISGASLSSDAPSYFTNYFLDNSEDKPLFLDRSPEVFDYIYQHLQGYHIEIPNGDIFTKLFTDSIYFNLPRLKDLLLNDDYYHVEMLHETVKVPKKLLHTEGNYPNFFSVTFEALYRDLSELMISRKLIRPPPQAAPKLNRDGTLLKELVRLLQGVDIEISSKQHKQMLIKEAKYYRFSAIVEKLSYEQIFQSINEDEETEPGKESIVVDLNDINAKNFKKFPQFNESQNDDDDEARAKRAKRQKLGFFQLISYGYQRKYGIDPYPRELIIKIGELNGVSAKVDRDLQSSGSEDNGFNYLQFQFHNEVQLKIKKLLRSLLNQTGTKVFKINDSEDFNSSSEIKEFQLPGFISSSVNEDKSSHPPKRYFQPIDADIRFYINDKLEPLTFKDEQSKLLLQNSYWRFDMEETETGLSFEFILLKADAVIFNQAQVYKSFLK